MKNIFAFILILLFTSFTKHEKEEALNLNTDWKFILGDNLEYAQPGFNDLPWKTIKVDKIWENLGYDPYDGFAWYRLKIVIPSTLKEKASLKDSLLLFMGKINNFDQTFLNGKIIGINGKNVASETVADTAFLKAPISLWDVERRYTLSVNDPRIFWDKENVIAVRVFDQGGQGGMYTGNQMIRMTKLSDYLSIDFNKKPFLFRNDSLEKEISIQNKSDHYTLAGEFKMVAVNKLSLVKLLDLKEEIKLKPMEQKSFILSIQEQDQSAVFSYLFISEKEQNSIEVNEESPYICTPATSSEPKINGASITGARSGRPFLFTIPASGERPMQFEVSGLPKGLYLDPKTGIISGKVDKKGEYVVTVNVSNIKGKATRGLKIFIGDQIALTPPMGWNSWNCWGLSVDAQKVIASAKTYRDKGLINHGWSYINIDDGWEIVKDKEPKRDPKGNILTNEKFPDMKALGDSIHALGLKFGIYSSPGPLTCGGYTASYQHELQDAQSFARWGVDYLKYDWCSYDKIAKDTSVAERKKPYFVMRDALNKVDRDIVYSLCQYGMSNVWEWGAEVGGNLWRTTGDITDTWESLKEIGFGQVKNAPYAGHGHWNDPDMLIVGWVGWGPSLHPTRLTPDEQYTHISLWCLLSAPLLIGCDLARLDEFTLNLLTNDEVIAINQDPSGKQATPIIIEGDVQVWIKELYDGKKAIGIFNLGETTASFKLDFKNSGLAEKVHLRDLWRQKDLGEFISNIKIKVPSHGVLLFKTD
jgi:alpha-galactosidase